MIRFAMVCAAGHEFEGWFKSNALFDAQRAGGDLACPVCDDREVRKAIMAPAVARAGAVGDDTRRERLAGFMTAMREVRAHVEKNFENVGDRFPSEVRGMHEGLVERRDVYGKASPDEAKALIDEGIPIQPLPMLPKLDG